MSYPTSWLSTTTDAKTAASNTAVVITYTAAGAKTAHALSGISWSYSGTPVGRLTIQDGSSLIFDVDITAAGPGFIPFLPAKEGSANTSLVITLYAGGSGVVGKLNVLSKWTKHVM